MKVTMIGTGHVELVSGVRFSGFGDEAPRTIVLLEAGEVPIYERGLEGLMAKNVEAGRLRFTGDLKAAVAGADAVLITVGTPLQRGDDHAGLTYVMAATEEIAHALTGYTEVVTNSTVPVGTNRQVAEAICAANPQAEFDVVADPGFLREGAALCEHVSADVKGGSKGMGLDGWIGNKFLHAEPGAETVRRTSYLSRAP